VQQVDRGDDVGRNIASLPDDGRMPFASIYRFSRCVSLRYTNEPHYSEHDQEPGSSHSSLPTLRSTFDA